MGHEKVLGEEFDVGKFEPEVLRAGGDGRLRCEAELCAVAQRLRGPFEKKGDSGSGWTCFSESSQHVPACP